MFVLAHLSDLHMAVKPELAQLFSKRGLGYINWQRGRKLIHRPEVLEAVTRDLKAQSFDHIAVTGDLVNLSLPDEYAAAGAWLAALGNGRDVTVVPGNHDVYIRAVEPMPAQRIATSSVNRKPNDRIARLLEWVGEGPVSASTDRSDHNDARPCSPR